MRLRSLIRDNRGSTAVEFAIAIPAVLAVIFGTIDISRTYVVGGLLNQAIREVSRRNMVRSTPLDNEAFASEARSVIANISQGLIEPAAVVIETEAFEDFAALNRHTAIAGSNAPAGLPSQIVHYRFTYGMDLVTPFVDLIHDGAAYEHTVEIVVQNEPGPLG